MLCFITDEKSVHFSFKALGNLDLFMIQLFLLLITSITLLAERVIPIRGTTSSKGNLITAMALLSVTLVPLVF